MKRTLITLGTVGIMVGGLAIAQAADAHPPHANALLRTPDGTRIGMVDFTMRKTHTDVKVFLTGAPGLDAFHGFHIHANDAPGNGVGCIADPLAAPSTWFQSADGHYNPTAQSHGHHVGDMPVVYVNADGGVETKFRLDAIDPAQLAGKVVILHVGPDNYNNIPLGAGPTQYTANSADATTGTAKTGNAGDRAACGVIKVT